MSGEGTAASRNRAKKLHSRHESAPSFSTLDAKMKDAVLEGIAESEDITIRRGHWSHDSRDKKMNQRVWIFVYWWFVGLFYLGIACILNVYGYVGDNGLAEKEAAFYAQYAKTHQERTSMVVLYDFLKAWKFI